MNSQGRMIGDFLASEMTGDLMQLPGVGPHTASILRDVKITFTVDGVTTQINGITNSFTLIGVFLIFKSHDGNILNPKEHFQAFCRWLSSIIPFPSFDTSPKIAYSIAEKANISFPGIYEGDVFVMGEKFERAPILK